MKATHFIHFPPKQANFLKCLIHRINNSRTSVFVGIKESTLQYRAESLQLTFPSVLFSSCAASACVDVQGSIGAILGVWQSGLSAWKQRRFGSGRNTQTQPTPQLCLPSECTAPFEVFTNEVTAQYTHTYMHHACSIQTAFPALAVNLKEIESTQSKAFSTAKPHLWASCKTKGKKLCSSLNNPLY